MTPSPDAYSMGATILGRTSGTASTATTATCTIRQQLAWHGRPGPVDQRTRQYQPAFCLLDGKRVQLMGADENSLAVLLCETAPMSPNPALVRGSDELIAQMSAQLRAVVKRLDAPVADGAERAAVALEAAQSLTAIQRGLLTVIHLVKLEGNGAMVKLEDIGRKLADGWKPEGKSVDEVLATLRKARGGSPSTG